MVFLDIPWGVTGALLATTYLQSLGVAAAPSVDVQLKAPFAAAPYLVELLFVILKMTMVTH